MGASLASAGGYAAPAPQPPMTWLSMPAIPSTGWSSMAGEYRLAGVSRPSASAIARTWCGAPPQQMPM